MPSLGRGALDGEQVDCVQTKSGARVREMPERSALGMANLAALRESMFSTLPLARLR